MKSHQLGLSSHCRLGLEQRPTPNIWEVVRGREETMGSPQPGWLSQSLGALKRGHICLYL